MGLISGGPIKSIVTSLRHKRPLSRRGDESAVLPPARVIQRMREDWDNRACEDPFYYVCSTERHQSEDDFDASGRLDVEQYVSAI